MTNPRFFALVPAAGIGERSGAAGPKQYVEIAGRPMLAHTLAALAAVPRITQTLVVLSPADDRFEAALPGCAAWTACSSALRSSRSAGYRLTPGRSGAVPM